MELSSAFYGVACVAAAMVTMSFKGNEGAGKYLGLAGIVAVAFTASAATVQLPPTVQNVIEEVATGKPVKPAASAASAPGVRVPSVHMSKP